MSKIECNACIANFEFTRVSIHRLKEIYLQTKTPGKGLHPASPYIRLEVQTWTFITIAILTTPPSRNLKSNAVNQKRTHDGYLLNPRDE